MRAVNIIGQKFGRLTVTERAPNSRDGKANWECLCDCGVTKIIPGKHLRNGSVESCTCLWKERFTTLKHGEARRSGRTPEYRAWLGMMTRCKNKATKDYILYGARGIKVCDRWDNYENFLADMGRRPSPKHSIDRWPNKDGNYEPSNCRWATSLQQVLNQRPPSHPRQRDSLGRFIDIAWA